MRSRNGLPVPGLVDRMRRLVFTVVVLLGVLGGGAGCTRPPTPRTDPASTPTANGAASGRATGYGSASSQGSATGSGDINPPGSGAAAVVGPLTLPRASHTATLLPDGRVLIAGGCTADGCDGIFQGGRSELFDPHRRGFVSGPRMVHARAGHTATSLPDGRVLLTGGFPAENRPPLASTEVFDPGTGTFRRGADLGAGRGGHTATRLRDGRVLIVGGVDGRRTLSTVEVFDPRDGSVRTVAPMPTPRATHAATLLADGRVLVVGGQTGVGHGNGLVDTAVVYHPGNDTWRGVGRLREAKYKLALAPLPGGGALVVGGQTSDDRASRLASTELFAQGTGQFSPGPAMAEQRYKISDAVAVLPDGRVVLAGGSGVEVYGAGRVTRITGAPDVERQCPTATVLADGMVLVTGGYDDRTRVTASAILVHPG